MKTKELAEKDDKSIKKLLEETKAKLVKDRFKIASREATNVSEIGKSRKMIARIATVVREREIVKTEEKEAKKAGDK